MGSLLGHHGLLLGGSAGPSGIKVGLQSWWDLGEASGSRMDSHGTRNLIVNGTVSQTTGLNGNASLSSSGGSLGTNATATPSPAIHTGDFTIAGVFKTGFSQSGIISRNSPVINTDRQFLITLDDPSGTFYFAVSTNGGTNDALLTGPSGNNNSAFHTYICWRDTNANTINAVVDNGSVVSVAFPGTSTLYNAGDAGITLHGVGPSTYVNGSVCDSTGIWNRMLTSAERTALYNSGAWRDYAGLAGI